MKKNIRLIISIVILVFALSLIHTSVNAGTVSTLKVTAGTSNIIVSGTTSSDVQAVAIAVYNEEGTKLITMVTTSVNDSNVYSDTITLNDGTYTVKVADYEGGGFITEKVTVGKTESENENTNTTTNTTTDTTTNEIAENTTTDTTSSNPKTGDNIILFATIFAIATLGTIITIIILNKNRKVMKH